MPDCACVFALNAFGSPQRCQNGGWRVGGPVKARLDAGCGCFSEVGEYLHPGQHLSVVQVYTLNQYFLSSPSTPRGEL